jgi:hypothetical protein
VTGKTHQTVGFPNGNSFFVERLFYQEGNRRLPDDKTQQKQGTAFLAFKMKKVFEKGIKKETKERISR